MCPEPTCIEDNRVLLWQRQCNNCHIHINTKVLQILCRVRHQDRLQQPLIFGCSVIPFGDWRSCRREAYNLGELFNPYLCMGFATIKSPE